MRVDDEGVDFKSPFDGSIHKFTPEKVVEIQEAIGSDIAMVLDECLAPGNDLESTKKSVRRTGQWAERALKSHEKKDQNLFGITQGGFFEDLRKESTLEITSMGYIHHLIKRGESTGMILATYHNIYFLTNLMKQSRNAIIKGEFDEFKKYVIEKINHKKR